MTLFLLGGRRPNIDGVIGVSVNRAFPSTFRYRCKPHTMKMKTTIATFGFATQKFTSATTSTTVIVVLWRGKWSAAATLRSTVICISIRITVKLTGR